MVLFNGFNKLVRNNMRINFGGGNVFMAEHFLNGAKVGSAVKKMSRKRMAQDMGGNFRRENSRLHGKILKIFVKSITGNMSRFGSQGRKKPDRFAAAADKTFTDIPISIYGIKGGAGDGNQAFFAPKRAARRHT